eukprot:maker-scaffold_5-snap-gene-10.57-mRNA-1 protein AED:0.00 eAED:0.00 QI:20/1/1/1/1/1/3/21/440
MGQTQTHLSSNELEKKVHILQPKRKKLKVSFKGKNSNENDKTTQEKENNANFENKPEELPSEFISNVKDIIYFQFNGEVFGADFVHQVFSEDERIRGYKDIKIDIVVSEMWAIHPTVSYDSIYSQQNSKDLKLDNQPLDILLNSKAVPKASVYKTKENFKKKKYEEKNSDFIEELLQFSKADFEKDSCRYKLVALDSEKSKELYTLFLDRCQALAYWFIETASLIDPNNVNFILYLLFKVEASGFVLCGYNLIYKFENPYYGDVFRICQMLLVKPFQRKGLGYAFLKQVYEQIKILGGSRVNAEDPCLGFSLLRDKVERDILRKNERFNQIVARTLTPNFEHDQGRFVLIELADLNFLEENTGIERMQIQRIFESTLIGSAWETKNEHLEALIRTGIMMRIKADRLTDENISEPGIFEEVSALYDEEIQIFKHHHQKIRL